MSQNQVAVPAYLQPTVCGEGGSAVTVYPLDVRTSVVFCRSNANLPSPESPEDVCSFPISGGFPSNVGRSPA
ncbi:MAG: hypothetical protein JNN09_01730 [Alphaproteobacteria bacterium]|nr:hypothetical protein [Alphaproteobacteria bacterium]